MIASKDRSGWFGASDIDKIVGNWNTKTWLDWWLVKMGVAVNNIETVAMSTGTHKEHQILEFLSPFMETDKQIIIEDLRLRINLDGNVGKEIFEVKTHSAEKPYKTPKKHIQQVVVQMYGYGTKTAQIASYGLVEEDYKNYFLPIDKSRLILHPVEYDERFINEVFLPRITYLADCLTKGVLPDRERKWS